MKIINLDELELKCIEFGIKNNFFTKEDLKKDNLVSIVIKGSYRSKTIDIWIKGYKGDNPHNICEYPITFNSETWEKLYYQLDCFFRETWNYLEDNSKMPLYMKIAELIGKQSKNGFVNASEINRQIRNLL